jgi:hypothetical protein
MEQSMAIMKKLVFYGIFLFALFCMLSVAFNSGYTKPQGKAVYSGCIQELQNISSGLQQQINEQGNLREVRSIDDVCHHVIAGHDVAKTCRGEILKRVNEICGAGRFKFKKIDNFKYELKAKSNEKMQCRICVTESAAMPTEYEREGCREFRCIHDK